MALLNRFSSLHRHRYGILRTALYPCMHACIHMSNPSLAFATCRAASSSSSSSPSSSSSTFCPTHPRRPPAPAPAPAPAAFSAASDASSNPHLNPTTSEEFTARKRHHTTYKGQERLLRRVAVPDAVPERFKKHDEHFEKVVSFESQLQSLKTRVTTYINIQSVQYISRAIVNAGLFVQGFLRPLKGYTPPDDSDRRFGEACARAMGDGAFADPAASTDLEGVKLEGVMKARRKN